MNIIVWGVRLNSDMGHCRPYLFAPGLNIHTVLSPSRAVRLYRYNRKTHPAISVVVQVDFFLSWDVLGSSMPVSVPAEGDGKGT